MTRAPFTHIIPPMNTTNTLRPVAVSAVALASAPAACECCGRPAKTVPVTDGESLRWFGVGCAARAMGATVKAYRVEVTRIEREAARAEEEARAATIRSDLEADRARCAAALSASAEYAGLMGDVYAARAAYDASLTRPARQRMDAAQSAADLCRARIWEATK